MVKNTCLIAHKEKIVVLVYLILEIFEMQQLCVYE
jgi:hypothetical protein